MVFREATIADIPQIQIVRNAVKENRLSNPALVTDHDCAEYITRRGKGWVCLIDDIISGFSIVDLEDHNVWALFIDPGHEKKGIGRILHDKMLNWYFTQTDITAPGTRAEAFYRKAGWREAGIHGKGEIKFELSANEWKVCNNSL